jgi:hypothetical protein
MKKNGPILQKIRGKRPAVEKQENVTATTTWFGWF